MSQIHVNAAPGRKGLWALCLALCAGAALLVWWTRTQQVTDGVTEAGPTTPMPMPTTVPSAVPTVAAMPMEVASTAEEAHQVISEQVAAKAALGQQATIPAVKGPVTARPSYVSVMEWQLLQGVAKQHLHPDEELTRLVNTLRFNKLLEQWQDLPKSAESAKRQAQAQVLLDELPLHVQQGDMDLAGARALLPGLLGDAEPDAALRSKRAEAETTRLLTADRVYATAQAAQPAASR